MVLPRNVLVPLMIAALLAFGANAQLTTNFYATTCPNLQRIVRTAMAQAIASRNPGPRISASILRLFFHDCFVNGCDASILLDDTSTFTGEKNSFPNRNSAIGFEVIDIIKTRVDAACNSSVSCADILAMAAREGVSLLRGPTWDVFLGRRDARTASQSDANSNLPGPASSLAALITSFSNQGLSERDMVALSGGHTLGVSQCNNFRTRIYNETNINPGFANIRRRTCPATPGNGDTNLAPLDDSPFSFDNSYFRSLVARRGLLHSDQELFNGGTSDQIVRDFANFPGFFRGNFSAAMVRMGNIRPLTGNSGEVRRNCRVVN